ncbi:acyl carrier protein [Mycolicibacterium peregrinum]|uniref:Acyl carrier protein n=1 Tax=Mycolicibacterium peregrinum TaxID=43304 RepID=A0A4Z0HXD5_MYCPR|nr:acyl carrier protein [Mycolicibacterium peregrinum]TGB45159.1 acyl carrier protein [Mycolicibacterium peregrinum]TGB46364.1 acyl carrier protein [Mycolicibacterium peregrinum]
MGETSRSRILAALAEVLYVDESDLIDGDATDLRDLGLDSVRFVLLMKQLGIDRESDVSRRLAENLSLAGWVHELEKLGEPV